MFYPLSFFYKVSGDEYTDNPKGAILNIRRLLQNLPAWRKTKLSKLEKKSLIFADWTAKNCPLDKQQKNISILAQLMDDGFELYLWQNGQVKKFSKEDLPNLYLDNMYSSRMVDNITPDDPDTIIKKAMEQQHQLKAKDQILVLDDYWFKTLKDQKEPQGELRLSDLSLTNKKDSIKALELMKKRTPETTHILIDNYYPRADQSFYQILLLAKYLFPNLPINSNSFKRATVNGKELTELLNNFPASLSGIESLIYSNNVAQEPTSDFNNLHQFLSQTTALRELSITGAFWPQNSTSIPHYTLSTLEHVEFGSCWSTLTNVHTLLSLTKTLKTLVFYNFEVIDDESSLEHFNLVHLERLSITDREGSKKELQNPLNQNHFNLLLKKAKQIKILHLRSAKISIFGVDLPSSIEELSIDNPTIRTVNLTPLHQTPNLKKLTLNKVQLEDVSTQHFNLEHLEELYLLGCNITPEQLQRLLSNSPKLKIVKIFNNRQSIESFEKDRMFNNLDYFYLANTQKVRHNVLSTFLENMNGVKKLHLAYHYEKWDPPSTLASRSLSQLETLKIIKSNVNVSKLDNVLKNAKNLKSLHLESCAHLSYEPEEEFTADLNQLEELSYISNGPGWPFPLLRKATGLKRLFLVASSELQNQDLLNPINLPNLEFFSAKSNMDDQILQYCLGKSSKLLTLEIVDCIKMTGEFATAVSFKSLSLLRINKCHQLSGNGLQNMLLQAPHLKILDLSESGQLIAHTPKTLSCESLEELNLHKTTITPELLTAILKSASNLKTLDLSGTPDWDLTPLRETLAQYATSLEYLNLNNSSINAQDLKLILRALPHLKILELDECNQLVMDDELEELLQSRVFFPSVFVIKEYSKKTESKNAEKDHKKQTVKKTSQKKSQNKEKFVDAQTRDTNPDEALPVKHHFYSLNPNRPDPAERNYRLQSYNTLDLNPDPCEKEKAFLHKQQGPLRLNSQKVPVKSDDLSKIRTHLQTKQGEYYWGTHSFILTDEWQPLPSLSLRETMTHYQTQPQCDDLLINYSERDNQYYVRKGKPGEQFIKMDFILELEAPKKTPAIPDDIRAKMDFYNKFEDGELDTKGKDKLTGQEYLTLINDQQKGACRHRAVAFQAWMNETHKEIQTRTISNDIHEFPEMLIDDEWVSCELGGSPAKLEIDYSQRPDCLHPLESTKRQLIQRRLETWNKKTPKLDLPKKYCEYLTQKSDVTKRLVEVTQHQDVQALQLALQQHCQATLRPFFYVNSPEDLICSAPWISIDNQNRGSYNKGPGGPLHQFLSTAHDSPPVIIVNYDAFDANDIVRFNGLLDDIRHADGTPLPHDALVIGIIDRNKPDCYQGEDFYSRLTAEQCPITSNQWADYQQQIAPLPFISPSTEHNQETFTIDLFNAPDWEERLLGRWKIDENNLYFESGELEQALSKSSTIEIKNAPLMNEKFLHLWQQAVLHGHIQCATGPIEIHSPLKIITSEGYSWPDLRTQITQVDNGLVQQAEALNPSLLMDFITRYHCDNDKKTLTSLPGLIEEKKGNSLHVNLTRSLSLDEWALILSTCAKHHVKLHIHTTSSDLLPQEILHSHRVQEVNEPLKIQPHTRQITTDDADVSLSKLQETHPDSMVIDVSECGYDDLLIKTTPTIDKDAGKVRFQQTKQALLLALEQNKTVVLKGQISQELVDHLAPLLIKRQLSDETLGQLILLSEQKQPSFSYLPVAQKDNIELEDKRSALVKQHYQEHEIDALDKHAFSEEPLSRLKARLNHKKSGLDHDPWSGIYDLPNNFSFEEVDAKTAADIAAAFSEDRFKKVMAILNHSPFVAITGITGTGKSTFVTEHFSKDEAFTLYTSETQMQAWAEDKTADKTKILFIDEANLSHKDWSEMEGLFHDPKGILINGIYHELSEQHKVIFAFNPQSYGDERKVAPFFERHGGALVFDPLPPAFIYERILKPVFPKDEFKDEDIRIICDPILQVYRFLTQRSTKEVLISPRELQMMALLAWSAYEKNKNLDDASNAAYHYAYKLALHLTPEAHRKELDEAFKSNARWVPPLSEALIQPSSDFVITHSREPVLQLLDEVLQLRDLRMKEKASDTQKYGGLGGIIIEGEPGIGKSELIYKTLSSLGYKKIEGKEKPSHNKAYYHIPVSMQSEDKEKLLRKAFNEGHGVLIDEINSSPMMERLLNALLMGKTPEGKEPEKAGFFVIGTQNPTTMAGRQAASTALNRRLITATLPLYTKQEMSAILLSKGLNKEIAAFMVDTYEHNRQKAERENLSPLPTFRDVQRLAKDFIRAEEAKKMMAEIRHIKADFSISTKGETVTRREIEAVDLHDLKTDCSINTTAETLAHPEIKAAAEEKNDLRTKAFRDYLQKRKKEAKWDYQNKDDLAGRYHGIAFFARMLNKFDAKEKVETAEKIMNILNGIDVPDPTFSERELGALNNKRLGKLMKTLNDDQLAKLGLERQTSGKFTTVKDKGNQPDNH